MTSPFDLLLLDYGGVCTPSHDEYLAGTANEVRPECLAVVSAARDAGVVVAILSNELASEWIERNPVLREADHVISCSDNRIYKPDRRAYQRVLLVTGASADRTLYVDDEPDNIAGASGVGMETMHFDPVDAAGGWSRIASRLGIEMSN